MAERPVELSPRALRDVQVLSPDAAKDVLDDIAVLGKTPWPGPPKVKKPRGHDLWRVRTGQYRSIVEIRAGKVVVLRVVSRADLERILATL